MQPFRSSLFMRLFLGMVLVSILAIGAATGFLYIRFVNTDTRFREGTLRTFARTLIRAVQDADSNSPLTLPSYVISDIHANDGRFDVVTEAGSIVAGSTGVNEPLAPPSKRNPEYFSSTVDGRQQFGLSAQIPRVNSPLWAQVAFPDSSIVFDSVLEEFVQDIAWISDSFHSVALGR